MTTPTGQRKRLLSLIHIAKKQLGLSDDDYRDFLEGVTAKRSAKGMDLSELNAVIQAFEKKGFKVKGEGRRVKGKGKLSPKTRDKAKKTPVDKVRALWIRCYQAGKVRERGDDALQKFCRTVTGVERVEWLKHHQAKQLIEILETRLQGETEDGGAGNTGSE
ncbi:MAG: regulatory protein GemA [Cyanobacteria bacterium J06638_20]